MQQYSKEDIENILRGLYCEHKRMRYTPCEYCVKAKKRCLIVSCPDCGLVWDNGEDSSQ